jgi:hypothetical protein
MDTNTNMFAKISFFIMNMGLLGFSIEGFICYILLCVIICVYLKNVMVCK